MSNIENKILELKERKNIAIISSYSISNDIQKISDFTGGLIKLYKYCDASNKRTFLYCGPDYLGNILSCLLPNKIFFKLEENTQCNLTEYMTVSIEIKELRRLFPLAKIVSYYKSSLKMLYHSDYIVDDCNINYLFDMLKEETKQLIFIPDYNLGYHINNLKKDKDIEIVVAHCFCNPLNNIRRENILNIKEKHPDTEIIIHPETNYHLHNIADKILGYDDVYDYLSTCKKNKSVILCYIHSFIKKIKEDFPELEIHKPTSNLKCYLLRNINYELFYNILDKLPYKFDISENYKEDIRKKILKFIKS